VGRELAHPPPDEQVTERIASLWQEAEAAVQDGEPVRARRYLRWILTVCPDDEEAWLLLARLAPSQRERLACLEKAYSFHPDSNRVQIALRRSRTEQLESAVGELRPKSAVIGCLPDERCVPDEESEDEEDDQWLDPGTAALGEPSRRKGAGRIFSSLNRTAPVWLSLLVPLVVYVLTACSTVYNLDSAEFSAAVYVLGIVRATGYPLYLLLGKLFTVLLPVGDVAFRLNIMSAVCAAGTIGVLYSILLHLTRQRATALAASLLFAFSYYFWSQAVVAEVYALHTLLAAGLLWLLLRWEETRADGLLAAFGLLYGLSFGNHVSTILLAPAFVLFLLAVAGRALFHPKRLLFVAGPFVVGLGIYLYLPLRYLAAPTFNYAGAYDALGNFVPLDMTRPGNLWWLVSGRGFQELMFDYRLAELVEEVGDAAYRLWGNFLGIGLVPGLLGAWAQGRRRPRHLLLFGLVFGANMVFFINYRVVDKATMFGVAYLVWAVWVGEGLAWLVRWVQERRHGDARRPSAGGRVPASSPAKTGSRSPTGSSSLPGSHSPAWTWGLVLLAVVALVVNWPLVNVRTDTRARDRAEVALALARPGAIIFGWWTSAPPMHYLQTVEERRPDVLVINRFLIGAREMYSLIDRSLGQRAVYVMELDEGLVTKYRAEAVGPMFELRPRTLAGVGHEN